MRMPEASVYKDDHLPVGKNDIGLAWERGGMQSVAITELADKQSYQKFGLGIFTLDSRHATAALLRRQYVHKSSLRLDGVRHC